MWDESYIAVDWGTTNRRAWLLNPAGHVINSMEDSLGLMSIAPDGFDDAVAQIRNTLGAHPMLLAGMVGSDRGWRKAGYVTCPANASDLARDILWIEPMHTGIVPGVCQIACHADVMRGEEVQIFGAQLLTGLSGPASLCLPGTHTKWVQFDGGRINNFHTAMTGEIFQLLKTKSILAPQMEDDVVDGPAFQAGLNAANNDRGLLSNLFNVRASHLLNQSPAADASYASGLLIGSDVRAALEQSGPGTTLTLIGRRDLCDLYASALNAFGETCHIIDGADAFRAGITHIIQSFKAG